MGSHSSRPGLAAWLKQPTRAALGRDPWRETRLPDIRREAPIRSCSGWGLPCRGRCRRARCALAAPFHPCRTRLLGRGGLFSVALSLAPGPKPDGRRVLPATLFHGARTFLGIGPERIPGDDAAARPPGTRAPSTRAPVQQSLPRSRWISSSNSSAPIWPSISPVMRCGRQRRSNARIAAGRSEMS